ncbi:MAG: hypothetical protein JRJ62_00215 [Deltaproteobacteria bacterium]|nr:hypothetical protein [Deltaproteobacteria bacterium]
MATEYEVGEHKMDGGELDTFYKLFWFGSQDDGDLPAKSGMAGLIQKGLAVKNYTLPKIIHYEKPNGLSVTGFELALKYYHSEYIEMRNRLREIESTSQDV